MAKTGNKFKYGVGRRKEASIRVRLYKGKGESLINDRNPEDYFSHDRIRSLYNFPLKALGVEKDYYFTAKTSGGGLVGQAEALSLGIARALITEKPELKPKLKKLGLLKRDPRVRQRRMVGTGGKSRRKKQSPKR